MLQNRNINELIIFLLCVTVYSGYYTFCRQYIKPGSITGYFVQTQGIYASKAKERLFKAQPG
jgi:hypothetical protein